MNSRQKRFCHEYLIDLNAKQAARRAGYTGTARTLEVTGSKLVRNAEVKAYLEQLKARRLERLDLKAEDVLRKLIGVAFADPRKLVEYRRRCCRHCHGKGFAYQRTDAEYETARAYHEERVRKFNAGGGPVDDDDEQDPGEFDEQGGGGFDRTRLPHERCPECRGEGKEEVFIHDTDELDDEALALYAGIEQTRDGVKVIMHDQARAREQLGRHLKLFTDVVEHKGLDALNQRMQVARHRLRKARQTEEPPA